MTTMQAFGCVGHTMRLASGPYFDLTAPDPGLIDVEDIATGLANTCRFGGQIDRFYSVAEHCYWATYLANADGVNSDACRAILFHDAAEAYCGDVIKPLKLLIGDVYGDIELNITGAISTALNIDFGKHKDVIRHYDQAMLIYEKCFHAPGDRIQWEGHSQVKRRKFQPECWQPSDARARFLFIANNFPHEG